MDKKHITLKDGKKVRIDPTHDSLDWHLKMAGFKKSTGKFKSIKQLKKELEELKKNSSMK